MTAGGGSAQTLDLPPGKALSMGTIKLRFCHRRMRMLRALGLPFFLFNGEREPFMLIRGLSRRLSSRASEVIGMLADRQTTGDNCRRPPAPVLDLASVWVQPLTEFSVRRRRDKQITHTPDHT